MPPPVPRDRTAELPVVERVRPPVRVSWEKVKNPYRRTLADGWGFTAAGVIVIVAGWSVWAAASRGTGVAVWPGFVVAGVLAGLLFVVARTIGYLLVERTLRRARRHARWSHLAVGLFLTATGVWYLVNTHFQVTTSDWLQDAWEWIADRVRRD